MVAITLACIPMGWVSYGLARIRERHELTHESANWRWPAWESRAPAGLWLLGEQGRESVNVDVHDIREITEQDQLRFAHAGRLFPEAEVRYRMSMPAIYDEVE